MTDWNDSNSFDSNNSGFFRRWFGRFWRWFKNFFALIGFVYTVIPVLLIWYISHQMQPAHRSSSGDSKKGPSLQTLWLILDKPILASEPHSSEMIIRSIFGGDEGLYLPNVRSALKKAAEDPEITDLQIVFDGLHGSMAELEELREILVDFKTDSKKPMQSWVRHMDNAALLISSATDKVTLTPVAEVMIPGPAFPQVYFGDALKKLGIEMQVVRAGKYKSAFEAFVSNEPSAESKEMMSSLESSLRNRMVKLLSEGRKKQDSETFLWLKESVFTAAKAKELGMVDELGYMPVIDLEDGKNIVLEDYSSDRDGGSKVKLGYSLTPEKSLALIEASGEIMGGENNGEQITPNALQEELEWARVNPDISAVVLRVSSPGGSASASDEIWDYVRRLNAEKPVIASFGSVAASGGYYISVAAKKIVADPTTITGSIGVIGMVPSFDGFKDKYGITFPITTQSNRQAMLSGKKMSADDHKYIGDSIDATYRTFKSRVAEGRKMSLEQVEKLAQGRVYSGLQAKELGLVDELGSLKSAFQLAKKEAGLDEKKLYKVLRYEPSQLSLSECLSSMSKMRRCLKRHGAQIKLALKSEVLGEDALMYSEFTKIKNLVKSDRIQTLYTGSVPRF